MKKNCNKCDITIEYVVKQQDGSQMEVVLFHHKRQPYALSKKHGQVLCSRRGGGPLITRWLRQLGAFRDYSLQC